MDETIDRVLNAISDLVARNEQWSDKAAAVVKAAKANSSLETSLDEFLEWFEDEGDEE